MGGSVIPNKTWRIATDSTDRETKWENEFCAFLAFLAQNSRGPSLGIREISLSASTTPINTNNFTNKHQDH